MYLYPFGVGRGETNGRDHGPCTPHPFPYRAEIWLPWLKTTSPKRRHTRTQKITGGFWFSVPRKQSLLSKADLNHNKSIKPAHGRPACFVTQINLSRSGGHSICSRYWQRTIDLPQYVTLPLHRAGFWMATKMGQGNSCKGVHRLDLSNLGSIYRSMFALWAYRL